MIIIHYCTVHFPLFINLLTKSQRDFLWPHECLAVNFNSSSPYWLLLLTSYANVHYSKHERSILFRLCWFYQSSYNCSKYSCNLEHLDPVHMDLQKFAPVLLYFWKHGFKMRSSIYIARVSRSLWFFECSVPLQLHLPTSCAIVHEGFELFASVLLAIIQRRLCCSASASLISSLQYRGIIALLLKYLGCLLLWSSMHAEMLAKINVPCPENFSSTEGEMHAGKEYNQYN